VLESYDISSYTPKLC